MVTRLAVHANDALPGAGRGRTRLARHLVDVPGRGTLQSSSPGSVVEHHIAMDATGATVDGGPIVWSAYDDDAEINGPRGFDRQVAALNVGPSGDIVWPLNGPGSIGGFVAFGSWTGCVAIVLEHVRNDAVIATKTLAVPSWATARSTVVEIPHTGLEWELRSGDVTRIVPQGTAGGKVLAAARLVVTQLLITSALPDPVPTTWEPPDGWDIVRQGYDMPDNLEPGDLVVFAGVAVDTDPTPTVTVPAGWTTRRAWSQSSNFSVYDVFQGVWTRTVTDAAESGQPTGFDNILSNNFKTTLAVRVPAAVVKQYVECDTPGIWPPGETRSAPLTSVAAASGALVLAIAKDLPTMTTPFGSAVSHAALGVKGTTYASMWVAGSTEATGNVAVDLIHQQQPSPTVAWLLLFSLELGGS